MQLPPSGGTWVGFDFAPQGDFDNLPPGMDLEIFALSEDFNNLAPGMDLEIFAPFGDFNYLSPQLDLEIFALSEDLEIPTRSHWSEY
uniref:Uncharacterized protein n=1 Tax=Vespula pensylvanica TaxID=30213 RepID=A0A834KDQ0_VESPE|nr:hypothetical protein H0235_015352 [Vespula pensylvanica]